MEEVKYHLSRAEGPPLGSPLLTVQEAIRWLRLDEPGGPRDPAQTLKRYRDMGLLRGTRIGRAMRYHISDLERFVAKQSERLDQ